MTPVSLERRVEIETPEQTVLSYTLAGVGSRASAAIIDLLVIVLIELAITILLSETVSVFRGRSSGVQRMSSAWVIAVVGLIGFGLLWGYYVFFEAIWDGQTPGKRWLHIRVVQDGGYSVSFGASAVRNLVRIVDIQPMPFYGVGLVSMIVSRSGKRLGDIAAGTIVVHEQRALLTAVVRSAPAAVTAPAITSRLTEEEFALLGRFIARRTQLDQAMQASFTSQLEARFRKHLPEDVRGATARLVRLFEMESDARARGLPAPGAKGAARERHAIVAINAERWREFSNALSAAQRMGLRAMSPEEVSRLVSLYREVSTDLARLRTASESEDQDAIFYVSRLLGAGHNFLYRQRSLSAKDVWRFLSLSVPREIRRSARYIVAGALFLFGPMLITYVAVVRHPELERRLNPPNMIDRVIEDAHGDSLGKHEYVAIKDFERPVMASGIIANNVQVTYAVFAFGITAGLMTLLMLILNGMGIGAAMALYTNHGVFHLIRDFVVAHSVLELSAICIAAGGGFLLAMALLLPGAHTRREAFVINGRRAIRLITASTLMLLGAGTIEGLISPRTDIPFAVKASVSAATAVLLAFWFSRGRGGEEELAAEDFAYSEPRAFSSR